MVNTTGIRLKRQYNELLVLAKFIIHVTCTHCVEICEMYGDIDSVSVLIIVLKRCLGVNKMYGDIDDKENMFAAQLTFC